MILRDYQIPAVEALVRTRRGVVQAPAGSGKTIIGAAALARWAGIRAKFRRAKMRVAWVANTKEQCEQARAAMDRFAEIKDCACVDVMCYQSGQGLGFYDLVILDECHHIAAPFFRKSLAYHDGVRWGLSATPDRADEYKADVYELIGPIVHVVERKSLIEAGQLAKARVVMHQPNFSNEMEREIMALADPIFQRQRRRFAGLVKMGRLTEKEIMNRALWHVALEKGITDNAKRNDCVIQLAREHLPPVNPRAKFALPATW